MNHSLDQTSSTTARHEYAARIKLQLDSLNHDIDALELQANSAKEVVRQRYREELGQLRAQSHQAQEQFNEIKRAGEDTWDKMVVEMDKVRDAFTHAFNDFKARV